MMMAIKQSVYATTLFASIGANHTDAGMDLLWEGMRVDHLLDPDTILVCSFARAMVASHPGRELGGCVLQDDRAGHCRAG